MRVNLAAAHDKDRHDQDGSLALVKHVAKKPKSEKDAPAQPQPDADEESARIGYAAAIDLRKAAMESQGLKTEMRAISKEDKKAERERKKALTHAQHLLK